LVSSLPWQHCPISGGAEFFKFVMRVATMNGFGLVAGDRGEHDFTVSNQR
jgi:hypothetical protein